jgi:hypothetical protein
MKEKKDEKTPDFMPGDYFAVRGKRGCADQE